MNERDDMILLDVTPHALGIRTIGNVFELIPQNTTVPTSRQKIFTTSRDNQTAVKILVMQGDASDAGTELLGEFILTGLRRAPKGALEIEVTFEINADGMVSVRAKDLETGLVQSIQVTATSGLTRDEIQTMIENSQEQLLEARVGEFGPSPRRRRLTVEIERLFPQVERIVAAGAFGRDALDKARGVVSRARQAVAKSDVDALKVELEGLSRTQRMFKGVVTKS